MKTFYWSFLLMLLPSMAYTQNTEKENEFTLKSATIIQYTIKGRFMSR